MLQTYHTLAAFAKKIIHILVLNSCKINFHQLSGASEIFLALPTRLSAALSLFDMPDSMVGIFDPDLAATGIEKEDERVRTLDAQALRHTLGLI
ncbi:MAG: hypothetical protein A2Y10_04935 [Planctomycetes bacterium GWF2_41_51]|nr:MAG: hypothetical protein A2Y10_04935 [Planctomycetes bacterium GWF2_41_51]HBG25591.1 hypothetical protein [Phycisphaerales bacterium]